MNDAATVPFTVPPIRKQVTIAKPVAEVFRLFTTDIGKWWPLSKGYKIGQAEPVYCAIEPRVGGRLFERSADGQECDWGVVLAWDPPHKMACSWHPGSEVSKSQRVEIVFVAESEARTRVELVHSGWESTPEAQKARDSYNNGWVFVFERCFADYASAS